MRDKGLAYEAQVPITLADFAFRISKSDGTDRRLCVEADGRAFHDANRDAARDQDLIAHHNVAQVLRFTGSQIWHNEIQCAEQIAECLQALSQTQSPGEVVTAAALLPEPLPEPLPALSEEQEACLPPREGVILTLAPAGSGKTRVLTRRVVEAVRAGVKPERILCVVFNRAAREVMEERIHQTSGLPLVAIRTLHSIGYEIAKSAPASPFRGFGLASERTLRGGIKRLYRDCIRAQAQALGEYPRKNSMREAAVETHLKYAAVRKASLNPVITADQVEGGDDFDIDLAARVYDRVENALAEAGPMTFDDQIYKGVEALLDSWEIRRLYQQRYDVLLVDEFQDLTPAQFLLVQLLTLPQNNLFAVGDDDQMINGFAGAEPRLMRDFTNWFPGASRHTLGENHRCAPSIVRASASVIEHNPSRFPKKILPAVLAGKIREETPDAYRLVTASTVGEEAREAVQALEQWHKDGIAYGEIAILVRVKEPAAFVQMALKAAQIPFVPLDRAVFFTSRVGSVIGAYLRLCLDPDSATAEDISLALSTPPRNLSKNALEQITREGWAELRDHPSRECRRGKRNGYSGADSSDDR